MKRLFFVIVYVLICSVSFGQKYYNKTESDARFPSLARHDSVRIALNGKVNEADSINPFDYVYTKQQTKALPTRSNFLEGLQRAGYGIKALPNGVNSTNILSGTYTLIDGDWQYVLVDVPDSVTLTGLGCMMNTPQASFTSDGYNGFVIHSVNKTTGVMTKVAETPNDGDLWKAAAYAKVQKAFTTPVLLVPGTYAFSLVWNASATTTSPKIYMHGVTSSRLEYWHSAATRLSGKIAAQSSVQH